MPKLHYTEAVQLLSEKLSDVMRRNDFVDKPLKCVVLGGYALQALCDKYGVRIERQTDDIDIFTPDAKALIDDSVRITPTGAQLPLIDDFHAELFDWISGMDTQRDLELRIFATMAKGQTPIVTNGHVAFYIPTPEVFVANKLFSYRGDNSRTKDLRDVAILVRVLKEKDAATLNDVEKLVAQYNLTDIYQLAMNTLAGT